MKQQGGNASEDKTVACAVELLKSKRHEHAARICQLERARKALLSAAEAVRDHVGRSQRLGLVPRKEQTANDLVGCIWFAFDVGLLQKAERRQQASRAKELLSKEHMAIVFGRLLSRYRLRLIEQLQTRIDETRREHLQEAANRWVEMLVTRAERVGPQDTTEGAMTAICGLHFAYACHQRLDYGRMSPELQNNFSDLIDRVPEKMVLVAVRRLLAEDILDDEAFDLLRYVPAVRDAYLAVREACPSAG